jgi:hypothetical protein
VSCWFSLVLIKIREICKPLGKGCHLCFLGFVYFRVNRFIVELFIFRLQMHLLF